MTRQYYFDPDGVPITLEDWAARFEDYPARVLASDVLGGLRLVTLWLGFVDPMSDNTRLFGTALLADGRFVKELETYNSKADAAAGHARHVREFLDVAERAFADPPTPAERQQDQQDAADGTMPTRRINPTEP